MVECMGGRREVEIGEDFASCLLAMVQGCYESDQLMLARWISKA